MTAKSVDYPAVLEVQEEFHPSPFMWWQISKAEEIQIYQHEKREGTGAVTEDIFVLVIQLNWSMNLIISIIFFFLRESTELAK